MVRIEMGDLFESRAQTLVNTVNCVGVMGKGIALGFKNRFPEMFKDYVTRCKRREVKLGRPYLYKTLVYPWVLNFPTKDHWRSVARLESITQGLEYLLKNYEEWGITSLSVPPLGCGEGQLEWRVVGPTLHRYLKQMDIPVTLYAPYGTPHEELNPEFLDRTSCTLVLEQDMPEPRIQPGWIGLVDILHRIEEQPYHRPVGRTIFQKIAYIATAEGLPTGLRYERGSFGPFARGLKGITTRLVNNGLIREERLGRMFAVKVGPTFDDARAVYTDNLKQWEPIIEKVADLFMRMDTQQAETVASVLFVARSLERGSSDQPTEQQVLDEVMKWKQRRKPPLSEIEVAWTIRNLAALEWLQVRSSELPLPEDELLYA